MTYYEDPPQKSLCLGIFWCSVHHLGYLQLYTALGKNEWWKARGCSSKWYWINKCSSWNENMKNVLHFYKLSNISGTPDMIVEVVSPYYHDSLLQMMIPKKSHCYILLLILSESVIGFYLLYKILMILISFSLKIQCKYLSETCFTSLFLST